MRNAFIILGAAALAASSAIAQPPVVVIGEALPTVVVSFADLNIASDAGQARLVQRIRAAAKDLCIENNKQDLDVMIARSGCYKTAMSGGLAQLRRVIAGQDSGASLAAATLTIQGR